MEKIPALGEICRTCKYWNTDLTIPLCQCHLMTQPEDSGYCLSYEPKTPTNLERPVWPPIKTLPDKRTEENY